MNYEKLVTVNYSGGVGGEFFCNLLGAAIAGVPFESKPDSNNKFTHKFPALDLPDLDFRCTIAPLMVYALHADPKLRSILSKYENIKPLNFVESHLSNQYKFYKYVDDVDGEKVKENIRIVMRRFIPPPSNYTFANFHNLKPYTKGLGLGDIFPNSKNLVLTTTNVEYLKVFWFFVWYKNKDVHGAPDPDLSLYYQDVPSNPDVFGEQKIYMDKIVFGDNYLSYVEEVEFILSKLIGKNIKLDRSAIELYRKNNNKIIRNYFSLADNDNIFSQKNVDFICNYMKTKAYNKV